jgi:alkanesulfonate monooxygenase SsuD/methylene tetrahydromethanopterin reductase-like flavin-dependent oxidoreductase (luciferase family)
VGDLPIWVGIGGTPASAIRTGTLGLPLAIGLLLGPVDSFLRPVALYRQAAADAGHDVNALRISVSTGGYVGATSQSARDIMYPAFRVGMMENNHQRGAGFVIPRPAFDAQTTARGGLLVGSPQEVIDKIMAFHLTYGLDRVILQMGFGGVSHSDHLAAIERLGTEVAPVVRREVARLAGEAA